MKVWILSELLKSEETPVQDSPLCVGKGSLVPTNSKELVIEIASRLHQAPVPPFLAQITSLTQVSSSLFWSNSMHLEGLLLKF